MLFCFGKLLVIMYTCCFDMDNTSLNYILFLIVLPQTGHCNGTLVFFRKHILYSVCCFPRCTIPVAQLKTYNVTEYRVC